jgi:hypothetical protein
MRLVIIPILIGSSLLFSQEKPKPAPPMDVPKVLYSVPLAVETGKKTKLILRGAKLESVTEVRQGDAKLTITGAAKKSAPPGNYPAVKFGDSELEVEIELPKDSEDERVELLAVAPGGEGKYVVQVSQGSIQEKEPNNGFAEAQAVTLPLRLDGVIGQERDIDLYRFSGKSGQKVSVEILAARFGSPADLNLTLYDAERNVLAQCDDTPEGSDPVIAFNLPRDGVYFLGVQESNDLGGKQFGYRLRVK